MVLACAFLADLRQSRPTSSTSELANNRFLNEHLQGDSWTLSLLQRSHFVAALPQRTADQFAAGNLARELPFRLSGRLDPVMMVWNDALSPRASAKVFRDFVRSYALSHGYVRN